MVRIVYLAVAMAFWLVTAIARRGRPPVVAIYYHAVVPGERARFLRQMTAIADRAIGTAEIEPVIRRGAWPPRVCVTFDDGLDSVRTVALPILRRLGIPATVFAVAGHLGCRPVWPTDANSGGSAELTMSASALGASVRRRTFTLGSHGTSHSSFTDLEPTDVRREFVRSRAILEQATGEPVLDFAFPHGACDRALVETAFACGYRRVFTLSPPPGGSGGLVIGRMEMTPATWPIEFRLTAAGAYAWLPQWRRMVRRLGRLWPARAKVAP